MITISEKSGDDVILDLRWFGVLQNPGYDIYLGFYDSECNNIWDQNWFANLGHDPKQKNLGHENKIDSDCPNVYWPSGYRGTV